MSGEFFRALERLSEPVKVQITVRPDWCPRDQMLVIDAQRLGVRFNPDPFFEDEGPAKIILVHDEREAFKVRETIREAAGLELWESDDPDA